MKIENQKPAARNFLLMKLQSQPLPSFLALNVEPLTLSLALNLEPLTLSLAPNLEPLTLSLAPNLEPLTLSWGCIAQGIHLKYKLDLYFPDQGAKFYHYHI